MPSRLCRRRQMKQKQGQGLVNFASRTYSRLPRCRDCLPSCQCRCCSCRCCSCPCCCHLQAIYQSFPCSICPSSMWYVQTFILSGTARTVCLTKVVVAHIVIPHIVATLVPIAVIVAEGRPIDLVDRGCARGSVCHSLWKAHRHSGQLFIAASSWTKLLHV
jgi:hypothetical protein